MIVTDAGRGAVDAAAFCARRDRRRVGERPVERSTACGREMLQRTAKSCGPDRPDAGVKFAELSRPPTGLRQNISAGRRWQKSPGHRESTKETLKPLRAGMRVISGVLVVARVRSITTSAHRPRVHWASGIPHALFGGRFQQRLGRLSRRGREIASWSSTSLRAKRSNPSRA